MKAKKQQLTPAEAECLTELARIVDRALMAKCRAEDTLATALSAERVANEAWIKPLCK